MRHRLPVALGAGLALVAFAAWTAVAGDGPAENGPDTLTISTFHVIGMTCGGCEVAVRHVVNDLDGIEDVEASYKEERATVTYRSDQVTPDEIVAAIEELGYEAELASGEEEAT